MLATCFSNPAIPQLTSALMVVATLALAMPIQAQDFVRGDANGDGSINIADEFILLEHLINGGNMVSGCSGLPFLESADLNDNEFVTIADYVSLRHVNFPPTSGPPTIQPPNVCGPDGTGPAWFPSLEPSYVISGTASVVGDVVEVEIAVSSPAPFYAMSFALDFGALTFVPKPPFSNPLAIDIGLPPPANAFGNRSASAIGVTVLFSYSTPLAAGSHVLGTLCFDATGVVNPCDELQFMNDVTVPGSVGPTYFINTVVDEQYQDHHPLTTLDCTEPAFVRCDCNGDGVSDIADVVCLLENLFLFSVLLCEDAADVNDDGVVNIADPITCIPVVTGGGSTLPPPWPSCGPDPTPDDLGCSYPACP